MKKSGFALQESNVKIDENVKKVNNIPIFKKSGFSLKNFKIPVSNKSNDSTNCL